MCLSEGLSPNVTSLTFTFIRPTWQCSKLSFAARPASCVRTNFLATFRCFSVHSSFVFLAQADPRASSSQYLSSIFFVHALLPTSSNRLFWPAAEAFSSHLLVKHIFHIDVSVAFENQCVPMRPLNTQMTGLAHHCSCRSSHLSPHLDFLSLPHPRYFVRDTFFPTRLLLPSTEWPRWTLPPLL